MIKIPEIEACLINKTLEADALVNPKKFNKINPTTREPVFDENCKRCAVGELLHCVGVSDKHMYDLENVSIGDESYYEKIFNAFKSELEYYGITSVEEVEKIIKLNDVDYGAWVFNMESDYWSEHPFSDDFVPEKTRAQFVVDAIKKTIK